MNLHRAIVAFRFWMDVLYEDDALLAVTKPAGLLFHKGLARDRDTLVARVRKYLKATGTFPIHRLDRATSGVALFAKSSELAGALGKNIHEIEKTYVALVRGVAPETLHIDHPVPSGPDTKERVDAVTDLWRLDTQPTEPRHTSWVRLQPHTGRFHQLRRHCKHISHPIIGDSKHGKGPINRAFAEGYELRRMALHAAGLKFSHPVSYEPVVITSPIPEDLRVPLEAMGYAP